MRQRDFLDLEAFGIHTTPEEVLPFFHASTLLRRAGLDDEAQELRFADGKLSFHAVSPNSDFASVAADFVRRKLLEKLGEAWRSLETVMSSPDKVLLLQEAQRLGYRTYLYYVATEDPIINVSRVRFRVSQGGHPVPEDKIVSR